MNPRTGQLEQLIQWLIRAFSPEEMQGLLRCLPKGEEVLAHVPGRASPYELVEGAVEGLERRGAIDVAFFELLLERRSGRTLEIRTLQQNLLPEPMRGAHNDWMRLVVPPGSLDNWSLVFKRPEPRWL